MKELGIFDGLTLLRVRRTDAMEIGWQTGAWWMNGSGSEVRLRPLVEAGLMERKSPEEAGHPYAMYRFTQAGMDYANG